MNTTTNRNNNNIYFAQLVPTKPLLKAGMGIHNYDEGRELYLSSSSKFVGHVGFFKKAASIAANIAQKNENIQKILQELSGLTKKEQQLQIDKLVKTLGENIDVTL